MNNKGSLTLEALISIFFTSLLFLMCIMMINTFFINEVVNQGLYQTAIEMSSNNITTQYGNNIINAQDKTIEIFANEKIKDNLKYNILNYVDKSKIDSKYSLSKKEGYLGISYSYKILNRFINVDKKINYRSFLHKTIKVKDINNVTVYITDTGSKYHKDGCFYLRKSKHPISLSEAIKNGYTPCSKCYSNKRITN